MKRCTKCGRELPLESFYKDPACRDGRRGDCIDCVKAYRQARYPLIREQAIARAKAWQIANPERFRAYQRERRTRPEVKARERAGHLRRKFGITPEVYDRMLAEQGGRCAICKRRPTKGVSLHVDHEHRTKRVRGLLCFRCNNALGDFGDRADLLVHALDYLTPPPTAATRRRVAALVPNR
jgi:hypothetical protein